MRKIIPFCTKCNGDTPPLVKIDDKKRVSFECRVCSGPMKPYEFTGDGKAITGFLPTGSKNWTAEIAFRTLAAKEEGVRP